MADEPKLPAKSQDDAPQPQAAPTPAPRPAPPVVEREPLTITVVEPVPAEGAVQQQVEVEAPPSIDVRRTAFAWLAIIGVLLLLVLYRLQFSTLVVRYEHGLQRRIFGMREYDARRAPHSRFDQLPRIHDDEAHRTR
jgi:hypothetical protein